jgi:hypothetical protein
MKKLNQKQITRLNQYKRWFSIIIENQDCPFSINKLFNSFLVDINLIINKGKYFKYNLKRLTTMENIYQDFFVKGRKLY